MREGAAYGIWTTFGNARASSVRDALARTTGRQAGVAGLIFLLSGKGTVGSNMTARQRKASCLLAIAATPIMVLVAMDLFMTPIATTAPVEEFDTSAGILQAAIALCPLFLASLCIPGGKLADLYGEKRVFKIGLVLHGISALSLSRLVSKSEFPMLHSVAAASSS